MREARRQVLNAHYRDYSYGLGAGRGLPGAPPAPAQPAALLSRTATMTANRWLIIPELNFGTGGRNYGGGVVAGYGLTDAQLDAIAAGAVNSIRTVGDGGSAGGFDQGCSMAFDPATYRWVMPAPGGHAACADNSSYVIDFRTMTASVILGAPFNVRFVTDPVAGDDTYGDGPAWGPHGAHTYGGIMWDPVRSKVFFAAALGSFGVHANAGASQGFQPYSRPGYYTAARPLNAAFAGGALGTGWTHRNFLCELDLDTQTWERLAPDLADPRNLTAYVNLLAYDTGRQRVVGFVSQAATQARAERLYYWDRLTRNWVALGSGNQWTTAAGASPLGAIVYHPGEDRIYWVSKNAALDAYWLCRCAADGSSLQEYVLALPRRTGLISGQGYVTDCPADQTYKLDPATTQGYTFEGECGLEYCPLDGKLYLANADGFGQVWRLDTGPVWTALSPPPPWPGGADGATPWTATGAIFRNRIFRRWQYLCPASDGKPLFGLIARSFVPLAVYKGA